MRDKAQRRNVATGVIRDLATYRLTLWFSGQGRRLKAGEYRFDRAMTPLEVIGKIARGDVFVLAVTFPEGLTAAEMAGAIEQAVSDALAAEGTPTPARGSA